MGRQANWLEYKKGTETHKPTRAGTDHEDTGCLNVRAKVEGK